jgi:transposase
VHDLRDRECDLVRGSDGVAWEYLPHDFPSAKTGYGYYATWEADGTTQRIHDLLRERVRDVRGRSASPSGVVLESQIVKTSCNVGESSQGIDATKKIKGRKRHIATDTLGLLLAVIVTAASAQDSTAGRDLLTCVPANHSSVRKAWVDGGYSTAVRAHGARLGIDIERVPRHAGKGLHIQPRRWSWNGPSAG